MLLHSVQMYVNVYKFIVYVCWYLYLLHNNNTTGVRHHYVLCFEVLSNHALHLQKCYLRLRILLENYDSYIPSFFCKLLVIDLACTASIRKQSRGQLHTKVSIFPRKNAITFLIFGDVSCVLGFKITTHPSTRRY